MTRVCGRWLGLALLASSFLTPGVCAQQANASFNRAEIIDTVMSTFLSRYVNPDMAERMDSVVRSKLIAGEYAVDSTLSIFLRFLTRNLREVSGDRHIWIEPIPENRSYAVEGQEETSEQVFVRSLDNFGWKKTETLPCGVGYIKVDAFVDTAHASKTAASAFSLMANCQSLIIDLREHHGGDENMQILACSYFFDRPTELSSLYWTYLDSSAPAWSLPEVPGEPLYDKPLYLLTSRSTASGAEAFAYNLKHAGRATLVGEATAGAAHWTDNYEIPSLNVHIYVPVAQPINPITGTSWEGTGVLPHIEVPAEKALDVAYLEILRNLRETASNEQHKLLLDWHLPAAEAKVEPVTLGEAQAGGLVGSYHEPGEDWKDQIIFEEDRLVLVHHSGDQLALQPLTPTLFACAEYPDIRVQFVLDDQGLASELQYIYEDGNVSPCPRLED